MNNRIKQLITCATTRKQQSGAFGIQQVDELFDKEKFAEMLIKECAQLARDTNLEDVEGGDQSVLRAAKMQILEHFGIEE